MGPGRGRQPPPRTRSCRPAGPYRRGASPSCVVVPRGMHSGNAHSDRGNNPGGIGSMIRTSARLVLLVGLFVPCGVARAEGRAPGRPPNVLLLLSDDQRPDTIHALGNRVIRTPHLDRLVAAGTTFTRALSPSPVCVTSRAEILSGCSVFRNGVNPP